MVNFRPYGKRVYKIIALLYTQQNADGATFLVLFVQLDCLARIQVVLEKKARNQV